MASKRLGTSLEESPEAKKKPKLEISPVKSFCGIADITPQTGSLPQDPYYISTPAASPKDASATTARPARRLDRSLYDVWVVVELFRPTEPTEGEKPMVKILGVFTNAKEAIDHGEEHVRALRTVTTCGVNSEPMEEDDRADEDMSETSIYERKLEYFRDMYETDDEEDREDGGKHWTVHWGNVTEVWVEKRQVFEKKAHAGYFTPLPILDWKD